MITSIDSFKNQISKINSILFSEETKVNYISHLPTENDWAKEELEKWYSSNFKSFPLFTTGKCDEIVIPSTFMDNYGFYHKNSLFGIKQEKGTWVLSGKNRDSLLLDLEEFIHVWTENIYHDFMELMESIKKEPAFAGINDEIIIMKNLIKFYKDVKESKDLQLIFFHRLFIPKAVADEMTDILIMLFKDKLEMMEVDVTNINIPITLVNNDHYKINWLGKQQEFAELILELTKKNYISFPDISMAKKASLLVSFFDFTSSKRAKNPDIRNNILKHLKPINNPDTKTHLYFYDEPSSYKRKFDGIKDK
ncbi:MAG TPA: hypothetical protein VL125_04450 [Pelobium sp.]|nr:hypothetical protein [Pelobium sp.]